MAAKTVFGKILESATKHGPENECNWIITQLPEGKEPDYILQELPEADMRYVNKYVQVGNVVYTCESTSSNLHKNFMNGIADYLEQHTKIIGSFSGSNGSSSITATITNTVNATAMRTVTLSGSSGFGDWQNTFYNLSMKIKPVIMPGQFIPTGFVPCFSRITATWGQAELKSAAGDCKEGCHGDVMDTIGDGIIKDMKAGYTQSIPGTVGAYIGTLTVNKIECD